MARRAATWCWHNMRRCAQIFEPLLTSLRAERFLIVLQCAYRPCEVLQPQPANLACNIASEMSLTASKACTCIGVVRTCVVVKCESASTVLFLPAAGLAALRWRFRDNGIDIQVVRNRNKWKCTFKQGIVHIDGREYVFGKATGDFVF